jgi:uncharacterized protein
VPEPDLDPEILYGRMARLPFYAVFMRPTEKYDWSTEEGEQLMRRHLDWMLRLEEKGQLLAAGPLGYGQPVTDDDPIVNAGGMFVIAASSAEEAESIAAQEPFFRHGWRTYTIRTWLLNEGVARHAAAAVAARFGEETGAS